MAENKEKLGLNVEDVKESSSEDMGQIAEIMRMMSDDPAYGDAVAASADGKIIADRLSVMARGETSAEEIEFWENYEKGLHKEVHGEGLEKWASFVPLAAAAEPDRRFPLIFCLHGAHNPIQMTEAYGIIQVAAREECIVIAPENENWDSIERLLAVAKEEYPVDWSRVYSMGYSFGAFSSSRIGLAHPEVFAGIGMGGMLFANDVIAHDLDGQWYEEYKLTEEILQNASEKELAMSLILGEHEMLGLLPLQKVPKEDIATGIIPLMPEDKKVSFNNLRRVGGCQPASFPEGEECVNDVEKMTGIRFEDTEIKTWNDRRYLFGYSKKEDGECLLETVAVEGMVHWTTAMYAEIFWKHLSKFARDPETGKLIRH